MLTRNFYNYVMTNMTNNSISNGFTSYMGEKIGTHPFASAFPFMNITELGTTVTDETYGVTIGGGTKAPTVDDYNLESPILSGFSVVKPGYGAISAEEDCVKWTATYAITNTGSESLRISEIGLFGQGHSSQTEAVRTLYDRTVLDAPIVIEPGYCKHITYTICFNYPAN